MDCLQGFMYPATGRIATTIVATNTKKFQVLGAILAANIMISVEVLILSITSRRPWCNSYTQTTGQHQPSVCFDRVCSENGIIEFASGSLNWIRQHLICVQIYWLPGDCLVIVKRLSMGFWTVDLTPSYFAKHLEYLMCICLLWNPTWVVGSRHAWHQHPSVSKGGVSLPACLSSNQNTEFGMAGRSVQTMPVFVQTMSFFGNEPAHLFIIAMSQRHNNVTSLTCYHRFASTSRHNCLNLQVWQLHVCLFWRVHRPLVMSWVTDVQWTFGWNWRAPCTVS